MSGGTASGSWTITPTTEDSQPRRWARTYASGTPVTTPISSERVEPATDTHRADHSPGKFQPSLCPPVMRTKNAPTGYAR